MILDLLLYIESIMGNFPDDDELNDLYTRAKDLVPEMIEDNKLEDFEKMQHRFSTNTQTTRV